MAKLQFLSKADVTYLIGKIKTALSGKVDTADGKGLSTNDLTNELKTSYDGAVTDVAALKKVGAQANTIEGITVNGTEVKPNDSKVVAITTPTTDTIKSQIEAYGYKDESGVNTIVTSKGYQTENEVQTLINNSIGKITGLSLKVVTSLPDTGEAGTIYFVAHTHSDTNDIYDEYIWVTTTGTDNQTTSKFEKIGHTDVDLSGYVKSEDISEIGTTELEALWNA